MKQTLLASLLSLATIGLTIAAPQVRPQPSASPTKPTQAQLAQILKQQENQMITNCEEQNLKQIPGANSKIVHAVHAFCACSVKSVINNPSYVSQLYQAQSSSKSIQELSEKFKEIGQKVVATCQQQVNVK